MNLENQKQTNEKTDEVFPFISAFNPNNPPGYHAIKNSVKVLKRNNVPMFQDLKASNLITVSENHPTLRNC